MEVDVYDPWINQEEVKHEYGIDILNQQPDMNQYSAIVLAVAHKKFKSLDLNTSGDRVIYDVKGVLEKGGVDARL
jgi:UDP-N-acetyl-D-galactosamine dehydrogenase